MLKILELEIELLKDVQNRVKKLENKRNSISEKQYVSEYNLIGKYLQQGFKKIYKGKSRTKIMKELLKEANK